jgi:hypothetical protein
MNDILVDRFEKYFRHPDLSHDVLRRGDRCIACVNIRTAIKHLLKRSSPETDDPELFDAGLEQLVKVLQDHVGNRVSDGEVGPSTRRLIVSNLLARYGDASIFKRYVRPETARVPSVFLSYARDDKDKVAKLAQWLRDRDPPVHVIMDTDSFVAGETIPDSIRRAVAEADIVVAVLSANSRDRDWPRVEIAIAEQLESSLKERVLIYLRLDATPLHAHDVARIAIDGDQKPLKQIGNEILYALTGVAPRADRHDYDENEPL